MMPASFRLRPRRSVYGCMIPSDEYRLEREAVRIRVNVARANDMVRTVHKAIESGDSDVAVIEAKKFLEELYLFGAVSPVKGYFGEMNPRTWYNSFGEWHGQEIHPGEYVRSIIFHADNAAHYVGCSEVEFQRIGERLTPVATPIGSAFLIRELNEIRKIYRNATPHTELLQAHLL